MADPSPRPCPVQSDACVGNCAVPSRAFPDRIPAPGKEVAMRHQYPHQHAHDDPAPFRADEQAP